MLLLTMVFVLNGGPEFRVDFGDGVVFCKHEELRLIKNTNGFANRMRANGKSMTAASNVLTILAAQAYGLIDISRSPVDFHLCAG